MRCVLGGGNLNGICDLPPDPMKTEKSRLNEPVNGKRQDHVIRRQISLGVESFRVF
jgi:hypothetical protein